jgi:hypothetical protein
LADLSTLPLLAELLLQSLVANPAEALHGGSIFRVTLELARRVPEFPPLLAACVAQLYYSLSELDSTSIRVLAKWLAMQLINTQLVWPYWAQWVTDCEEEPMGESGSLITFLLFMSPKKALIKFA